MAENVTDPVDAEQLAALERTLAERDVAPQWKPHRYTSGELSLCAACGLGEAAKVHIVSAFVQAATLVAQQGEEVVRRVDEEANRVLFAPTSTKPLASFVEAGAVDARLAQMQDELAQVRGMLHHVMVLVMVMGDRQKISTAEYDAAVTLIAKAEKDGPR